MLLMSCISLWVPSSLYLILILSIRPNEVMLPLSEVCQAGCFGSVSPFIHSASVRVFFFSRPPPVFMSTSLQFCMPWPDLFEL